MKGRDTRSVSNEVILNIHYLSVSLSRNAPIRYHFHSANFSKAHAVLQVPEVPLFHLHNTPLRLSFKLKRITAFMHWSVCGDVETEDIKVLYREHSSTATVSQSVSRQSENQHSQISWNRALLDSGETARPICCR